MLVCFPKANQQLIQTLGPASRWNNGRQLAESSKMSLNFGWWAGSVGGKGPCPDECSPCLYWWKACIPFGPAQPLLQVLAVSTGVCVPACNQQCGWWPAAWYLHLSGHILSRTTFRLLGLQLFVSLYPNEAFRGWQHGSLHVRNTHGETG